MLYLFDRSFIIDAFTYWKGVPLYYVKYINVFFLKRWKTIDDDDFIL